MVMKLFFCTIIQYLFDENYKLQPENLGDIPLWWITKNENLLKEQIVWNEKIIAAIVF